MEVSGEAVYLRHNPKPFDAEFPNPSDHKDFNALVESQDFDAIYFAWKNSATIAASVRQQAVTILTRPSDYFLPHAQPEFSQEHLLDIPEEIEGQETSNLRRRLKGSPELADELAEGVIAWCTSISNLYDPNPKLAKLQMEYQPLVLQLLPLTSSSTRYRLSAVYPSVDSLAVREGVADYLPTVAIIKDTEISPAFRIAALHRWLISAETQDAHSENELPLKIQAKEWLVEFLETWVAEESAESEYITKIVRFLENQSLESGDRSYVNPRLTTQIAAFLSDPKLKYQFVLRHVMDAKSETPFAIRSEADDELLKWLLEERGSKSWIKRLRTSDEEKSAQLALEERLEQLHDENLEWQKQNLPS